MPEKTRKLEVVLPRDGMEAFAQQKFNEWLASTKTVMNDESLEILIDEEVMEEYNVCFRCGWQAALQWIAQEMCGPIPSNEKPVHVDNP